jgi:hypothetical protein
MTLLPQDTFLGKLTILEVYEYYDHPVLFACHNAAQNTFLVVLLDETAQATTWLYVALSADRFQQVRTGAVDLHSAFKDAEDEIAYEVTVLNVVHPTQIRVLPSVSLQQLPEPSERLHLNAADQTQSATG